MTVDAVRQPARPGPPAADERLLVVVEDMDEDFEALTRALTKVAPAAQVVRYTSGRELFERTPERAPLLVLLDLNLPEENGLRVIHRLRSHPDWRTVPVVVLSGSTRPDDVAAAYRAGASGYLVKPFDPAELVPTVRALWEWWALTVLPSPDHRDQPWSS